ncbi:vWA domain-containing protein [Kitasatospora sp. KL5]|uniref:vWA domain-containing protein n=1 Tax=Kitasatospora sp. KL5 TaxID=3425125 RepID=UPI003D6E44EF
MSRGAAGRRAAARTGEQRPADPAAEAFAEAVALVHRNHALGAIGARICTDPDCTAVPRGGWAVVDSDGTVHADARRRAEPAEWAWVLTHCLLHLGFGHVPAAHGRRTPADDALQAARCAVVHRFQATFQVGRSPFDLPQNLPAGDEDELARRWRQDGVPGVPTACGPGLSDQLLVPWSRWDDPPDWTTAFAAALTRTVSAAMDVAGGRRSGLTAAREPVRPWTRALNWFVSSYPLLGGIAAGITLVADAELARAHGISVAAVNAAAGEIYVNPLLHLTGEEWRFVLGHEMLHAALRHGERAGARDPYLFNVACDYVVNGWLVEMDVGTMPEGSLYDPELKGLSAEEVYDRIARDQRRLRRLATLAGKGRPDILGEALGDVRDYVDLDEFYRRGLQQGFELHERDRGTLPAGLVEEIRALSHPPLPWDARLARWFDEFVPSPESVRSYARPSRRQSATPGIPRAGRWRPETETARCTFGVVLDTSGSMSRALLGKALGAIASYAAARDVAAARVVFCDAAPHDAGYLPPEEIAGRVRIRGRGGTVLQPGIDLLQRAEDFPPGAPVLVITDAECDVLRVRREHAYLVPRHAALPFTPRGPVFRMQ